MRGNVELIYEDLDENTQLTDCYYEKKDWRACKDEVSSAALGGWVISDCPVVDGEIQEVLEGAREREANRHEEQLIADSQSRRKKKSHTILIQMALLISNESISPFN